MQTGYTPLYIATVKGHAAVVDALLAKGADISLAYKVLLLLS